MAEIESFLSDKAKAELEKYKADIAALAAEYGKLAQSSINYTKSLKGEKKATKEVDEETKQYNNLLKQLNATKAKQEVMDSKLAVTLEREKQALRDQQAAIRNSTSAYKQLSAELEKNRLKAKDLAVQYGTNSKQFKAAQKEVVALDNKIKKIDTSLGQHQRNVGNYQSALSGLPGPLGMVVSGIQRMTAAAVAFIATPVGAVIGAIVAVLGTLFAYFKRSEEGQNAWNKIMRVGTAIMDKFLDVLHDVGKWLVKAFSDPKQAIADLWQMLKQNFINRIQGTIELFKALQNVAVGTFQLIGAKIKGLWSDTDKQADEATEKIKTGMEAAANASLQMATGIKDAGRVFSDFVDSIDDAVTKTKALADMEAERDKKARALIVERARLDEQYRQKRLEAEQATGAERIRLLKEAFAVQDELARREQEIAQMNLYIKRETNKLSESTKEDLDEEARLEARLFEIQSKRAKMQLTLQTRINSELQKQLTMQAKQLEQEILLHDATIEGLEAEMKAESAKIDAEIEGFVKSEEAKKKQMDANKEMVNTFARQNSILGRALALQQAIRDGWAAVQGAFKDTPGPLPVRILAAAGAAAIAASNVRQIMKVPTGLPLFGKGTKNTPAGPFIAGERGRELMVGKGGAMLVNGPTLFSDMAGRQVIPNAETEAILGRMGELNKQQNQDGEIVKAIRENRAMVYLDKYGIISVMNGQNDRRKYVTRKYKN